MRLCAVTLLASAGFAAAVSPHALGGATQTDPEPTTTAPPPDPAPTTVPRPDPAPPPAPPPRQAPAPEPAPAPQPAPPPPVTPPSPPPPVPVAEAASAPTPPPAAPKPRRRSRVVRRVEATPKPARPLAPRVSALRFGERIRHTTEEAGDPLADAALVAVPVRQSATERTTAQSIASLAILAALGLGALLLAFSAVPGTVLARSPHGFAVVRARVEIGLIGGAIVILSGAIFLVGS